MLFDTLNAFKEKLYAGLLDTVAGRAELDVWFHHYNAALFRRLVEIYMRDTPTVIGTLRQVTDDGDWAESARLAHLLRSSTAMLGAAGLAALFQEVEQAVASGAPQRVVDLVGRIEQEFRRVTATLQASLEEANDARTH